MTEVSFQGIPTACLKAQSVAQVSGTERYLNLGSLSQYRMLDRAISAAGEIQPSRHDPLYGGYHINFSRPLQVLVTDHLATKPLVFAI